MTVWEAMHERDMTAFGAPILYDDGHTKGGIYDTRNIYGAMETLLAFSRGGTGSSVILNGDDISTALLSYGISPWNCWKVGVKS